MSLTVYEVMTKLGRDEKFDIVRCNLRAGATRVTTERVTLEEIERYPEDVPSAVISALELSAVSVDLNGRVIYCE